MDKRKLPFAAATAAIALLSGFVFGYQDTGTSTAGTSDTIATPMPTFTESAALTVRRSETEQEQEPKEKLLESVEMDAETQWSIYTECGHDPQLFCAIMVIAAHEAGYLTTECSSEVVKQYENYMAEIGGIE